MKNNPDFFSKLIKDLQVINFPVNMKNLYIKLNISLLNPGIRLTVNLLLSIMIYILLCPASTILAMERVQSDIPMVPIQVMPVEESINWRDVIIKTAIFIGASALMYLITRNFHHSYVAVSVMAEPMGMAEDVIIKGI
jgi:hypothetical protein